MPEQRVRATGLERQFYSPVETAAILGIDRQTVYQGVKLGTIPCTQITPRCWCIPKQWVAERIKQGISA